VVGAGTGGTSATVGRYIRYRRYETRLCVVDPERSAFFGGWTEHAPEHTTSGGSRIEGIGRPRVEPSFLPGVVDRMIRVPDAASIAAMRLLNELTGLHAGGSTGTNLYGALRVAADMRAGCEQGSVVTLLCDGGERYAHTYYDDAWLAQQGLDPEPYLRALRATLDTGRWHAPSSD
jgi:cysteine synthase A